MKAKTKIRPARVEPAHAPVWLVMIADLRGSRSIPARERLEVDRALQRAIARTLRRFGPHFRLVPELLRGDEVQAVLRADAPALAVLTYLRAQLVTGLGRRIELRAGIGRGAVARLSSRGPFASDGEAFHRARQAIDRAKAGGSGRLTAWSTGDRFFDTLAETLLGLSDAFALRWTVPQWEAIAGRLEGQGLHGIARRQRVSFQSVSKRLRAAAWNEVHAGLDLLEAAVAALDGPPAVQRPGGEIAGSPARGRT